MKKQFNLRLPEDIDSKLQRLAQSTGRTKTFYAQEAIIRYLEEVEEKYTNYIPASKAAPISKPSEAHRGKQQTA